jgi:hypothetical protein
MAHFESIELRACQRPENELESSRRTPRQLVVSVAFTHD